MGSNTKWVPIGTRFFFDVKQRMIDLVKLEHICEEGLAPMGYELVDLEYLYEPGGWVLRIFIDHPYQAEDDIRTVPETKPQIPSSRITHQDCEIASQHLSTVLDVEDPINGPYRLEISSPGIPRPIRKERDFRRFTGQMVKIQLHESINGRKNFKGRLHEAASGIVTIDINGTLFELPLERIKKARLEVEF